jgi:hypothetical protein
MTNDKPIHPDSDSGLEAGSAALIISKELERF